ncbi:MAG: ABC transporter substrate-binding protein, partial [Thermofilum sp.]
MGILLPYTGVFATVAKTQEEGIVMAIDEINEAGGLNMPWGKVSIEYYKRDDEASLDTGVRRFYELYNMGVSVVFGQTWAPLALAINNEIAAKNLNVSYFPVCVVPVDFFKKQSVAPYAYVPMDTSWSIGYAMASYAIENLSVKKIFFLARSDFWGWDMYKGVEDAVNDYKAKGYNVSIVGYDEAPLGTPDFTPFLTKALASGADIFMFAQFGSDQANVLKQAHDLGLQSKMKIFAGFITNAVAVGVPPEDLNGVYALTWFYWNMTGIPDQAFVKAATDFVNRYEAKYGYPPDAYAVNAYIAAKVYFTAAEKVGSFDPTKIAEYLSTQPKFETPKGTVSIRVDHQFIYNEYMYFVVRGKGQRASQWDLFEIVGWIGGEKLLYPLDKLGWG